MAWAILARGEAYRPPVLVDMTGLQMAPGQRRVWKSLCDSHIRKPATTANLESCQVCGRIMRWRNGRTRRSPNPKPAEVLRDCVISGEWSAAHSILARSHSSNKVRIHLRRPTCQSHFSLAARRRTIHDGWPLSAQNGPFLATPITTQPLPKRPQARFTPITGSCGVYLKGGKG